MALDHGMFQADALEGLRTVQDGAVGLIITDPAYESLEKHRAVGTTTRLSHSKSSSNEWFPTVPNSYYPDFFRECFRVLARNTYMFVFCDPETYLVLAPAVIDAGFELRKPLVWYKQTLDHDITCHHCEGRLECKRCGTPAQASHGSMGMGYPFRSSYELILFAQKGKRVPPENRGTRDVLEFAGVRDGYPTEKPLPLLELLVRQGSEGGDVILDPFAGSGVTIRAAGNLGRIGVGFDLQQATVDRFYRLEEEAKPDTLEGGIFDFLSPA